MHSRPSSSSTRPILILTKRSGIDSRVSRNNVQIGCRPLLTCPDIIGGWPNHSRDGNENVGITSFRQSDSADEAGRDAAEIRIYCDNGAGWVLRPDDPDSPYTSNSQQPADRQEYIRPDDGTLILGPPRCIHDPGFMMETSLVDTDWDGEGTKPIEWRSTIDASSIAAGNPAVADVDCADL